MVEIMPIKKVQELRRVVDVLYGVSLEIFNAKKKALESGDDAFVDQVGKGKDIISILSEEDPVVNFFAFWPVIFW